MAVVEDSPECPIIDEKDVFPGPWDIVLIIILLAALWMILTHKG